MPVCGTVCGLTQMVGANVRRRDESQVPGVDVGSEPAPVEAPSSNYKWMVFSVMAFGLFFGVMDFGGTGVAIPTIADDLGLELRRASLIVIAFSLAISAVLLPVGSLSDLIGRKRSFIAGGFIFSAGAVASASAPGLEFLIAARITQAIGAAIVMANGMAIVAFVFPAGERGKGMGYIGLAAGLGSVAGPIVAGGMIDLAGWRSFFILLAAGTGVASVWAWIILDDARIGGQARGKFSEYDWTGAILSAFALTLLIIVVANSDHLATWQLVAGILGTVGLVGLFVLRETRTRIPMFDLNAFRSRQFSWAITARFLGFIGTSSTFFLMPFYLQDIQGYAASEVGFITFPGALGFVLTGAFSGRLSDRLGVKRFTVAGLVLVVVGTLLLATFDEETGLYVIMPSLLITGLGMGLWIAPNMSAAIDAVSSATYGVISAFINLVRNTASVIGIAIATALVVGFIQNTGLPADLGNLSDLQDSPDALEIKSAFVSGMRVAFIVFASVAAFAIIAALKTRNPLRRPELAIRGQLGSVQGGPVASDSGATELETISREADSDDQNVRQAGN